MRGMQQVSWSQSSPLCQRAGELSTLSRSPPSLRWMSSFSCCEERVRVRARLSVSSQQMPTRGCAHLHLGHPVCALLSKYVDVVLMLQGPAPLLSYDTLQLF